MSHLAGVYRLQARYADSERLYRRALAGYEKCPRPDRRELATVRNNLGTLYQITGRHAVAERLFREALAAVENAMST
jgi:tetratricopeptide (TPR) repeat protein